MKPLPLLALSALLLAGCDLLGPDDAREPVVTGVFVANQGNFFDGNGSVSTYDPATGTATTEAIDGLGMSVQSLLLHGGILYVVGGRVEMYDAETLQRADSIPGMTAPRYMAATGTRGFVTNLYDGTVSVLDLATGSKIEDVTVGNNPEGIAVVGGRVYVANSGFGLGSTVSVLDATTGDVLDLIEVDCDGPRSLAVDDDDEVWVFCSGHTTYDANFNVVARTSGAVRVLDGATGTVRTRIPIEGQIGAAALGQDVFHSAGSDEMYVVVEGERILRFDTGSNTYRDTIALTAGGAPIGAVGYDAAREQLYVARVTGYTTAGHVTIHRRDGTQTGQFTAGLVPTFITLREETR